MGYFDDDDFNAKDIMLRVESTIERKIERGIAKELITDAEGKKLKKALKKAEKQHDNDWWIEEKIYKSIEIATHLLKEGEFLEYTDELEILEKIVKA